MSGDRASPGTPTECLGMRDLERIARGDTWVDATRHLAQCERCRTTLAEVEANSRFLLDFAAEIASGELPSPSEAPTDDCLPQLEGYRLISELQRGGQGIVYRAIHEPSGRAAAVKVVRAGSWRRRARMEREAQLAAALRHPNIVTLHHCGELSDGRYAIAMELVNGATLDEWSRNVDRSPVSPRDRLRRKLRVFARVCDGVQHAHQHGVIHRDLKPANILVDDEDSPRILDFGVARRTDVASDAVTMTGELACTLAYASPEQVAGEPMRVDSRTDVYSLGAVLYELLTGRVSTPTDATVAQLVQAIANRNPPSPRTLGPLPGDVTIDADLETIITTAMAKSPDRRYVTAAALKADVERYLAGEAIDARRDSRWYVLRKAVWRNRRAVGGIAMVTVTIVTAASVAIMSRLHSSAERDRAATEARQQAAVSSLLRELLPRGDAGYSDEERDDARLKMRRLSEKIESGLFGNDPATAAAVRISLGDVCVETGSLRNAEVEFRSAVRMLASRSAPRDAQLATALDRLADLLARRRSFAEAQRRCEDALELRVGLFGENHADVAASIGTLARIRLERGDAREALSLVRRGLATCDRVGESADEVRASLSETAARAHARLHEPVEAIAAANAALALTFRRASDLAPETARCIDLLADCMADRPEAATLHRTAQQLARASPHDIDGDSLADLLALKERLLGASDPDLTETLLLLGSVRLDHRMWDEAIASARLGQELSRRTYGDGSMSESDFLYQEAVATNELGRSEECAALLVRRLAMLRPLLLGRDDLHLAVVTRELGMSMAQIGRRDDCNRLHEEAATLLRERLGSPHRELAWCYAQWGRALLELGDPSGATAKATEGLRMLEEIDASPQWHSGMIHCTLAVAAMRQGRFDDARRHIEVARATAIELGDTAMLAREITVCDEELEVRSGEWVRAGS
ncbi:MAG: serine/threonine-protein kinase [Phycisphaerales bacterium]